MSETKIDDVDNPEWTKEDFARARPAAEVLPPEVLAAFPKMKGGRPKAESPKVPISLRVDADVLEALKAQGPGWQTRANDALRAVAFPTKATAVKAAKGRATDKGRVGKGAGEFIADQARSASTGEFIDPSRSGVSFGRPKAAPGSRLKKTKA